MQMETSHLIREKNIDLNQRIEMTEGNANF